MRETGALAVMQGSGKTPGQVADRAFKDMALAAGHPMMGPAVGFTHTALTGKNDLGQQVAARVSTAATSEGRARAAHLGLPDAGSSQSWENLKAALWHSIPLASVLLGHERPSDAGKSYLERATELPGPFAPRDVYEPKKKGRR